MTLPYIKDSATSAEAAERAEPKAGTDRAKVLSMIRAWAEAGCTDEEIADATGMNPSTVRPRRVELVALGHVEDSQMTRPTRSGRKAVVWRAVPAKEAT